MVDFQRLLPGVVALVLCALLAGGSAPGDAAIRLNPEAFDFAAALIAQGHFVADKKGQWGDAHSPRSKQNDFMRDQGISQYAKWHLAIDERHGINRKARYKFPFGDFQNVHRCGLLAAKARAHEFGYQEIEDAAAKLLELIDSARPRAQKRVD